LKISVHNPSDVSHSRHAVEKFFRDNELEGERLDLLMIGVGEAITNAVKHASGGRVYAGIKDGDLWFGVADRGPGISSLILPRATLMRGFSTKPSLGLGYTIMLEVADSILLRTGVHGTTVILVKKLKEEPVGISANIIPDAWTNISG
jgi:anti-sigma regulatory factor (Ser/Thr protein kinase)